MRIAARFWIARVSAVSLSRGCAPHRSLHSRLPLSRALFASAASRISFTRATLAAHCVLRGFPHWITRTGFWLHFWFLTFSAQFAVALPQFFLFVHRSLVHGSLHVCVHSFADRSFAALSLPSHWITHADPRADLIWIQFAHSLLALSLVFLRFYSSLARISFASVRLLSFRSLDLHTWISLFWMVRFCTGLVFSLDRLHSRSLCTSSRFTA